jgi:hypothetical protein
MYPQQYIRYLNLPEIPNELLSAISKNFDEYKKITHEETYAWSDSFNKDINEWCRDNICDTMYWGFQIITGELFLHKDQGTVTKMNFVIDTGGDNAVTEFYDDDQTTLLDSIIIQPRRWHIFKADTYHCVKNIDLDKIRFGVTGKIF